MTSSVIMHLSPFGAEALERLARNGRRSQTAVLRGTALYYLADRDSGRLAWPVPGSAAGDRDHGALRVEIELDDETHAELEEEAARQGTGVEDLAAHALLYFLADLDSGRLPSMLEHLLEDDS